MKRKKPTCNARTRKGGACRCRPLPGKKRCALHGGASTGPKTEAGKAKARENLVKANAALAGSEHVETRRQRSIRGWQNRKRREKAALWAARLAGLPARWRAALERVR